MRSKTTNSQLLGHNKQVRDRMSSSPPLLFQSLTLQQL